MVIFDTTVMVDVLRGQRAVAPVIQKIEELGLPKAVAATTVQELMKGAVLASFALEVSKVEQLLCALVVLPFDEASAKIAGKIEAELEKSGKPIDIQDIQIASVALLHNELLITRNMDHFSRIKGLKLESY